MTKFEEELFNKVQCKFELTTEAEYKKSTLINHFKNWHSDEEFQELLEQNAELTRENNIVNQINSKLESQIIDLKSQLQQQALPVVPECMGEWIEILKTKGLKPLKNPETYEETGFTEETLQNIVFWISEHQEDYMRAWLDGYTVEKPQMFYLKNKLTGAYLYYDEAYGEATNLYSDIFGNVEDFFGTKTKFTKQEIDSMETGSYEQIEVAE